MITVFFKDFSFISQFPAIRQTYVKQLIGLNSRNNLIDYTESVKITRSNGYIFSNYMFKGFRGGKKEKRKLSFPSKLGCDLM